MEGKQRPSLSPGKRVLFIALMWLLPPGFFGALEGGLRLAGYGEALPIFVPVRVAPEYRILNREMARRYFSNLRRVPTGMHDAFMATKDSTTIRVFVQGGSSAAGYPYYYGGSFSRMLEQRLAQTYPHRRIEVVNMAVAAVNTYTLRDQVSAIMAEDPDAILIYAGHNEFYGALGAGSAESLGRQPWMVNLYLRLRPLRTVQLLRNLLGTAAAVGAAEAEEAPEATLMERMVREQTIRYGSSLYRAGLRQFRVNLRAILTRYEAAGVPVFIGTLASNERAHAPFASVHAPDTDEIAWRADYESALRLAADRSIRAGVAAMRAVIAADSSVALGFFALGAMLDALGQYEEARAAYLTAKDHDNLRFRASEDVNAIIRAEAVRAGAIVVETQAHLAAAAEDGIIGSDLMLEHLHPNLEGYFVLADAYYEALYAYEVVEGAQYVPRPVARREVLYTAADSLFGELRVRQLMSSWPFKPLGSVPPPMDTIQARTPEEGLALAYFHRRMGWYAATDSLRMLYESRGDLHKALRAALALIQQYPYLPRPYSLAADIMLRQRRFSEALVYYQAAEELEPTAQVQYMMGMVHVATGRLARAQSHLEQAATMDPQNSAYLLQLAQVYLASGQVSQARSAAAQLLAVAPNHPQGRRLLQLMTPGSTAVE